MNKVQYKSSNKKIMVSCALSFFILIIFIIGIQEKFVGDIKIMLLVAATLFTGIVCLVLIKNAKNAFCTNCHIDLFNVINAAEMQKIEIHYCPSCGAKIKI